MKKIISIILLATIIVACTDRFERINQNPFVITDESLAQDYNFGSSFTNLYRNIRLTNAGNYIYAYTWQAENWMTHTGTPRDQSNGRDMMGYFFQDDWNNRLWNWGYNTLMSPALVAMDKAKALDEPLFLAMAELTHVIGAAEMTLAYGPVIYTEYGEDKIAFDYDSEEVLYDTLFRKLDQLKGVFFNASAEKASVFARFDPQYGAQSPKNHTSASNPTGSTKQWAKFINSFKLRLAMRLVKVSPTVARARFEEAVRDEAGLMLVNDDNFWCRFTGVHPYWQESQSWTDLRMGSGHEEVLVGFEDPRIFRWWNKLTSNSTADISAKFVNNFPNYDWKTDNGANPNQERHPDFYWYKGIAPGSWLDLGKFRDAYSPVQTYLNDLEGGYRKMPVMLASEVYFLLAEGALRGWDVANAGGKSAQGYYEDGVRQSFLEWGVPDAATAAADYLLHGDDKMPINYVDPSDGVVFTDPSKYNSYDTRMIEKDAYTVKWKDDVDIESQLERLMTQKWIALYMNSIEAWSDFRRTGYPKVAFPIQNNSTAQWGVVPEGQHIKRNPFVERERLSNPGLANAIQKLGGPNSMNTRLWIHPEGSNF